MRVECRHELKGHGGDLSCVDISSDEALALTGSCDGTVRLWCTRSGELLTEIGGEDSGGRCAVNSAVLSPDGGSVLVAFASEVLGRYNVSDGRCIRAFTGHDEWVRAVSFSPDGATIATGHYDGHARVWNAWTGTCLMELDGHEGAVVFAELAAR